MENEVEKMIKHVGEEEPHYGLRKLSIGVASVLLGMTMYGVVGHADSVNIRENVDLDENVQGVNVNENDQVVLQSKTTGSVVNSEGRVTVKQKSGSNIRQNSVNTLNTSSATPQNSVNDNKVASQNSDQQPVSNLKMTLSDGTDANNFDWYHGMYHDYKLDMSFDIDAKNIVKGHNYSLGKVVAPYVSNNHSLPLWCVSSPIQFSINGQHYGFVGISYANINNDDHNQINLFLALDRSADPSLTGTQHFSASIAGLAEIGYDISPSIFVKGQNVINDKLEAYNFSNELLSSLNINLHAPAVSYRNSDLYWDYDGFGSNNSGGANLVHYFSPLFANNADLNKAVHGQMAQQNKNLPSILEIGGQLSSTHNDLLLNRDNCGLYYNVPVFHSDGKLSTEIFGVSPGLGDLSSKDLGDNLSIEQLRNIDFVGFGYSHQKDNSYYYLIKIPSNKLVINDNDIRQTLINHSWEIAADSDPQKAIQVTLDRMHSGVQLFTVQDWIAMSDPYVQTTVTDRRLWNNFMNANHTWQVSTISPKPIQAFSKGQSTVKLHLINSTNGAELSQVQSFTDWPDQGKKANLTISVPTGYQLVTTNTSDILKRLNLTGTAITANAQADYPKENTISDYYVLLAPKTENATINIVDENENNKVLYSGQVSGAFNSVIAGNDDVNSQLKKLLDSGLYDLDHNGLSDGGLYKDGTNTVTVSLKHHIDSTERHYRVIEDLPDGTEKVIVDLQATLYKDADSKFWYQDGAYLDGILQGTLLKHNNYVLTAGTRNQGDPTWLTTPVDRISGYSASMAGNMHGVYTDEVLVSFDDQKYFLYFDLISGGDAAEKVLQSGDYHIVYIKNNYPVTISYYDTTGKQIATSTTTHAYQDVVTVNNTVPAGYVLLAGQNNQLTVGVDHNELDLLAAPAIQRSQETKRVTRTIVYDDPKIQPVVQVVTLHRDKFINIVDNSIAYGQWIADGPSEFAAYVPVLKAGYVADLIAEEAVNGDSQDETVYVRYQSINDHKEYKYVDVNGVGYNSLPDDYQIVNGQDLDKNGILVIKKPVPVTINKIEYVKRIITVIMPNGRKRTIIQKTRKGGRFLKPHLPKLRGYNVDVNGSLDAMVANSDVNVTVKFVKM